MPRWHLLHVVRLRALGAVLPHARARPQGVGPGDRRRQQCDAAPAAQQRRQPHPLAPLGLSLPHTPRLGLARLERRRHSQNADLSPLSLSNLQIGKSMNSEAS
jgi:hypothetical protein